MRQAPSNRAEHHWRAPSRPKGVPAAVRRRFLQLWHRLLSVLGILLLWLLAWPWVTWADWPEVFRDQAEVSIVNLDVFVTGRDDAPVQGLQQEDFQLLIDGRTIDISNFYAVEAGRLPTPILLDDPANGNTPRESFEPPEDRRLLLLIYIDNDNISPGGRHRVFEQLKDFLLDELRPEVSVMLVSNDRSLTVRQGVTSVPHEIFVALDKLEETAPSGQRFGVEELQLVRAIEAINVDAAGGFIAIRGPDAEEEGDQIRARAAAEARAVLPQIHAFARQRYDQVQDSLKVLRHFVDAVAGLPRRKAVIYVADSLPLKAGEALFAGFEERVESLATIAPTSAGGLDAGRYDATESFLNLVRHANASGVSFYSLDAQSSIGLERGSAATRGRFWTPRLASLREQGRRESRLLVSEGTGGRADTEVNTLLDSILSDFDNHYSLGYNAAAVDTADRHRLEVKVRDGKKNKWTVRHRNSFRVRSTDELMGQRALAALLFDDFENSLGAGIDTQEAQALEDGQFAVPLMVQVPLGKLVLLPGGKEHQAQVSLYVAVRDDRGRTSQVVKHLCPIRIPNSEMLMALGRSAGCGVQLRMRGGPQSIAVVVRDEVAAVDSTLQLAVDVGATTTADDTTTNAVPENDSSAEGP